MADIVYRDFMENAIMELFNTILAYLCCSRKVDAALLRRALLVDKISPPRVKPSGPYFRWSKGKSCVATSF